MACFVIYVIFQIDIQLETGEYFLSNKRKSAKIWQEKQEKQAEKTAESKRKREEAFIPPKVNTNILFAIFSTMYNYLLCSGLHFQHIIPFPLFINVLPESRFSTISFCVLFSVEQR